MNATQTKPELKNATLAYFKKLCLLISQKRSTCSGGRFFPVWTEAERQPAGFGRANPPSGAAAALFLGGGRREPEKRPGSSRARRSREGGLGKERSLHSSRGRERRLGRGEAPPGLGAQRLSPLEQFILRSAAKNALSAGRPFLRAAPLAASAASSRPLRLQ